MNEDYKSFLGNYYTVVLNSGFKYEGIITEINKSFIRINDIKTGEIIIPFMNVGVIKPAEVKA